MIAKSLTPAQRRVLLAMHPTRPADVWRIAPRLATLRRLDACKVIARGERGWVDARLTDLGRDARAWIEERSRRPIAELAAQ